MKQKILTLFFAVFMMMGVFSLNSDAAETEELPMLEQMTGFSDVKAFAAAQSDTIEVVDRGYCGYSNVEWGLTPDGILLIIGSGKMPYIGWANAPWYKYRNDIYAVAVAGTVKNVGEYAFASCENLEFVYLEEGVTQIGKYAFQLCKRLVEIVIPNSVSKIEEGAFMYCVSLEEITIPKNVKEIPKWCFNDCSSLYKITFNNQLQTIGEAAFQRCYSLTTIKIPESVTTIKELAFVDTGLISITLPNSIKKIEYGTFRNCNKLKTVNIPSSVVEIGGQVFGSCDELEKITIPNSVKVLKESLFANSNKLREVKLPDYITSLPPHIFSWCKSLETVIIPKYVEKIEARAFWHCDNLTSIRIPANVALISEEAFLQCDKLQKILIMNPNIEIGENIFAETGSELVLWCHENSTAHTYAVNMNYPHEFIDMSKVTERFGDVTEGKWFVNSVQYVFDKELMSGSGEYFNPTQNVTRAQLVTTLYRLAGSPEVTDYSACQVFSDVEEGKYYTEPICWAYNEGIATGNDGKFHTTGNLTRQQMAAFFFRYAEVMGYDVSASADFSAMLNADKVSDYAVSAMEWAVGAGLINGSETKDDAGNVVYDLNPRGNTTRAQLSAILQRFCEGVANTEKPDTDDELPGVPLA